MDDFQLDDSGLTDLTGFDDPAPEQPAPVTTPAAAPATPPGGGQHTRQRATSNMISTGYRFRQFLKKGGERVPLSDALLAVVHRVDQGRILDRENDNRQTPEELQSRSCCTGF